MKSSVRYLVATALIIATYTCAAENSESAKPHGKDFSTGTHTASNTPLSILPRDYQIAVQQVTRFTDEQISKQLTPIRTSNQDLIWNDSLDTPHVLVCTWTTHDSYFASEMQPIGIPFTERFNVWVVVAPELRAFYRHYRKQSSVKPITARLEQLLGLPPNSGHRFIVELWVKPEDLFRPSADPEITDSEAELRFPEVTSYLSVSDEYKQWFEKTKAARYHPVSGPPYPWTRLGYTYDWGNPTAPFGLSEFVIREGAEIIVKSITPTEDYETRTMDHSR